MEDHLMAYDPDVPILGGGRSGYKRPQDDSSMLYGLGAQLEEVPTFQHEQYDFSDPIQTGLAFAKNLSRPIVNTASYAMNLPAIGMSALTGKTDQSLDQSNMDLMALLPTGRIAQLPKNMIDILAERGLGSVGGNQIGAINPKSYRISHTAPQPEGRNAIYDMADVYPEDIYDPKVSWNYYGHGGGEDLIDKQSAKIIASLRGNPDAEVTIYRAVPKGVKDINAGDWVTINKNYAKQHGESWVENGQYDIIEKKVKAKDIHTDANSIHEFGYNPQIDPPEGYEFIDN